MWLVDCIVLDDGGRPLPDAEFQECDGISADASNGVAPVDIILVVDSSGSMGNDARAVQENMDGFYNVSLINERIDQDMAKEMLLQSLGARAQQGDPAADMALVEILDKPSDAVTTLKKLFTPQEPEMSPEEQAMMQAQGMGGPGGEMGTGPPPAVQTILSQMESPGGGAMSVGQMR